MTKTELIVEVQAKTWFVDLIGSLVVEEEWPSQNAILYRAHVMVQKEVNVLSLYHIYFYTINEGEPGEVAYYKDANPDDQIGYEA